MFGFWIFLFGGIFLYSSFFMGGAPDGGWFGYTPLTSSPYDSGILPGTGTNFWAIGLLLLAVGSTTSALNFIVTVTNMRAPGMKLMRMPVFAWMMTIVSFLTIFALPVFSAALIMVFFDRNFGTTFFFSATGGDPFYQHMFRISSPRGLHSILPEWFQKSFLLSRKPFC
jgi:cytochrome c oxidase subunit 1